MPHRRCTVLDMLVLVGQGGGGGGGGVEGVEGGGCWVASCAWVQGWLECKLKIKTFRNCTTKLN